MAPGSCTCLTKSSSVWMLPCAGTTSASGPDATSTAGSKSFTGSNGRFLYNEALMVWLGEAISSVYPSGAARDACADPTGPSAPGPVSTTPGWPQTGQVGRWPCGATVCQDVEVPGGRG